MADEQIGRGLARFEDGALLTGRGRFAADLPVAAGTLHAAILRSPHAHADIVAIDISRALAMPGVQCLVTGEDARRWTRPFTAAIKLPIEHWCIATNRVRYMGEPVAVVVASDRYRAEDALEAIDVAYRPLPAIVNPRGAPALEIVSDRRFRYGDPEAAFATAPHRISITTEYPRNGGVPIECFVVIAEYLPTEGAYEVTANFQGPFALHPVMAMALGVPANKLRLRTPPDSGGSFGAKQAVFPYIVLMAITARKAGWPVKWVEDRFEHLIGASSATNRVTKLEAAVSDTGEVLALDWDQIEDCGAYLRAPEPATLYCMHGNMTGAYCVKHLAVRNRVVLTNKTPGGLNRGFGGPQVYFALERLMQRRGAAVLQ
jgi:2-furoyl-CoA dehydrogenase large subunit